MNVSVQDICALMNDINATNFTVTRSLDAVPSWSVTARNGATWSTTGLMPDIQSAIALLMDGRKAAPPKDDLAELLG